MVVRDTLQLVKRVTFELSNRCNYAHLHKSCPLNGEGAPVHLPSKAVIDTLEWLADHFWQGIISFHNYGEPLLDPRLFTFIDYAVSVGMPVLIWTNSWNLSEVMFDELVECGVTWFELSAYTKPELHRLQDMGLAREGIVVNIRDTPALDKRRGIYEFTKLTNPGPCHRSAPLNELIINRNGMIPLCCYDWQGRNVFGDLTKETLQEVLDRGWMLETYSELKAGNRRRHICKRCPY